MHCHIIHIIHCGTLGRLNDKRNIKKMNPWTMQRIWTCYNNSKNEWSTYTQTLTWTRSRICREHQSYVQEGKKDGLNSTIETIARNFDFSACVCFVLFSRIFRWDALSVVNVLAKPICIPSCSQFSLRQNPFSPLFCSKGSWYYELTMRKKRQSWAIVATIHLPVLF